MRFHFGGVSELVFIPLSFRRRTVASRQHERTTFHSCFFGNFHPFAFFGEIIDPERLIHLQSIRKKMQNEVAQMKIFNIIRRGNIRNGDQLLLLEKIIYQELFALFSFVQTDLLQSFARNQFFQLFDRPKNTGGSEMGRMHQIMNQPIQIIPPDKTANIHPEISPEINPEISREMSPEISPSEMPEN
ncbi:MAG: hypothetical protein BWY42_01541 [Candidatus Omnitrophica bacterium ADurb.Bin277]|nr:MAG: hypothetical protein BWY42_01541 [Candidatus Omnitrophica bacterium ADurb.Bin277]